MGNDKDDSKFLDHDDLNKQASEGGEGNGDEGQEPDYKALYEQAKANSRKWERQAKANMAAASQLEDAQGAQKTAEERISALETLLKEKEQAEARSELAAKVAAEKGIPAELVVGDDEETMSDFADKMLAHFAKPAAPAINKPGEFDRNEQAGSEDLKDFARQLLGN